jgi:transcriptional regulator with XRE-family HTH domain
MVDRAIGARIALRRNALQWSVAELAARVDLPVRELEEMESGDVRISAHDLFRISDVMDIGVAFFFEGLASSRGANTR